MERPNVLIAFNGTVFPFFRFWESIDKLLSVGPKTPLIAVAIFNRVNIFRKRRLAAEFRMARVSQMFEHVFEQIGAFHSKKRRRDFQRHMIKIRR